MRLSTQAKVGMLTLVSLLALSLLIIWKTDLLNVSSGYEMKGSFQSIEGLTIGSEIRYRGFRVGKVFRIDPGPYEIALNGIVYNHIRFPSDSKLRIAYDGIVGQKYLEIIPGTEEAIYRPPQVLYGITTSGIVDFIDIGSQNLVETKENIERGLVELKLAIEEMKREQEKIKNTVIRLSEELDKKARKSEIELLQKQAKMFQPLELVRLEDIKKLLNK